MMRSIFRLFRSKDQVLVDEAVFGRDLDYQDAIDPDAREAGLVAACGRALRQHSSSEDELRSLFGAAILERAKRLELTENTPSSEQRADEIIIRAIETGAKPQPAPRAYWHAVRIAPSVVLFQILVVTTYDDYAPITVRMVLALALINVFAGYIFYVLYYHVIHRRLIRPLTYKLFGSPVYAEAVVTLRDHGLKGEYNFSLIQDIIAKFFRRYDLRGNVVSLKNSTFHVVYMICLILGVYALGDGLLKHLYLYLFFGALMFLLMGFVMWLDRQYGEREETELIARNANLFVRHARDVLDRSSNR